MKILYRQDGSEVELTDSEAEKWLRMGLAKSDPVTKEEAKPIEEVPAVAKSVFQRFSKSSDSAE